MFNDSDLQQISKQGISQEIIQQQIDIFKKGFPFIRLKKAATPGDGIMQLNENDLKNYRDLFHNEGATMKMVKFVPSSGAASRMFKDLFSFYEQSENAEKAHQLLKEDPKFAAVRTFFQNIQQFAFFEELKTLHQQKGESLEENILKHRYQRVLELLLTPAGMNYGELPKALLKFHKYNSEARTPIDEHLQEGYAYCRNQEGKVNLHFTVSPQHLQYFQEYVNEAVKQFKTILVIPPKNPLPIPLRLIFQTIPSGKRMAHCCSDRADMGHCWKILMRLKLILFLSRTSIM